MEPRECEYCQAVFAPVKTRTRYCSKSCGAKSRKPPPGRPARSEQTKVCECGCGESFTRAKRVGRKEWESRRFAAPAHYYRWVAGSGGAGASRAAGRIAPRVVPSRDHKRKPKPPPPVAAPPPVRFGQVPVVVRVEPVQRTTRPRPSFGISRRSA